MIKATRSTDTDEILVRGDFQDFEKLSRIIDQVTGAYGAPAAQPFPEYRVAFSLLLGLAHLIRLSQAGRCELSSVPNGINENWIAPAGTPAELIASERPHIPQDAVVDEIDNIIMDAGSPDLEDFYMMNKDEKAEVLKSFGVAPEKISRYLNVIRPSDLYCFPSGKYPDITFYNTQLQFRIGLAEAALYAFLLRELLSQETLLQNMLAKADELEEGVREYQLIYCLLQARSDLALLGLLMEQLFSCFCAAPLQETLPRAQITPAPGALSAEDLLSASKACAEIREKKASKNFLKNWNTNSLFRVSELMKAHSEDGLDGALNFIDELLNL